MCSSHACHSDIYYYYCKKTNKLPHEDEHIYAKPSVNVVHANSEHDETTGSGIDHDNQEPQSNQASHSSNNNPTTDQNGPNLEYPQITYNYCC